MTMRIHGDKIEFPDGTEQITAYDGSSTGGGGEAQPPVAFRANLSVNQTVTKGTYTKLNLDTASIDTDNALVDGKFKPSVAGWYQVNGSVAQVCTPSSTNTVATIYKNGIKETQGSTIANDGSFVSGVNDIIYLNGTTDYLELWGYVLSTGTCAIFSDPSNTHLSAHLISSITEGEVKEKEAVVMSARLTTNQPTTANVFNLIKLDDVEDDSNSYYNKTTGRFNPKVAGYYQVNSSVQSVTTDLGVGTTATSRVTKNSNPDLHYDGSYIRSNSSQQSNNPTSTGSHIIYMNGTTDYLELWGRNSEGTEFFGVHRNTSLSAHLITGQSSGGGSDTTREVTVVDTAIGMVAPFAMDSVPTGWLHCDGSEVSRDTYSLLYSKVGDTYGNGDGSTTFNLPNLQDEFIRGSSDTNAVGNKQDDNFKAHAHKVTSGVGIHGPTSTSGTTGHIALADMVQNTGVKTVDTSTHATNSPGGAETRPRNVAMLYCINATAEPSSGGGETTPAKAPEVTVFKEGSGTYTTPEGALYLTVKMVGGGGGGSAANAVGLTAGVGGTTIFGEASCTGGGGGKVNDGSWPGGVANIASYQGVGLNGGWGGNNGPRDNSNQAGNGAPSALGGGGLGGGGTNRVDGKSGVTNTGAGGGGGGGNGSGDGRYAAGGGSAGAYADFTITTPNESYEYTVGTKGLGAVADTNKGGDGADGIIIVTAHFGATGSGGGSYTPEDLVWEDKTAENTLGTVYTNDTDVPRYVHFDTYSVSVGSFFKFTLDDKPFGYLGLGGISSENVSSTNSETFIIPSGSTYKIEVDNGAPVLRLWHEARMPVAVGTGGKTVAFRGELSVAQTPVTNSTWTKVNLDVASVDTDNAFTDGKFKPNVAGYYQVNGSVGSGADVAPTNIACYLKKNGGYHSYGNSISTPLGSFITNVSDVIYLDGKEDYIELFCQLTTTGTPGFVGSATQTYLSAVLVSGGSASGDSATLESLGIPNHEKIIVEAPVNNNLLVKLDGDKKTWGFRNEASGAFGTFNYTDSRWSYLVQDEGTHEFYTPSNTKAMSIGSTGVISAQGINDLTTNAVAPNVCVDGGGVLRKSTVVTYSVEEVDKKLAVKDKLIEKLSARLDELEKRIK